MDDTAFAALCAIWQADRPPRVWSVLVTLFGDIAQSPDVVLSGATVNAILGGIGIKPEAIRVALYRLRHDGWINSDKVGRTSNYSLTAWGRDACAAANPMIYGPWTQIENVWLMAMRPGSAAPNAEGLFRVGPDLWLSTSAIKDNDALILPLVTGAHVPTWLTEAVLPAETQAAAAVFQIRLTELGKADLTVCTPLQVAILRTLAVHEWRRIILKVPALPDFVMPPQWLVLDSKRSIVDVLARLPKPKADDLSTT